MSRLLSTCFLNGDFQELSSARISPFDRGFLFGDAVYEVIPVYGGRSFRLREHLDRLNRSLAGIRMPPPRSHEEWATICARLIAQGGAEESYIYIQVSRGAEQGRNHAWPDGLTPTLFAYVTAVEPPPASMIANGVAAITRPDNRWARRDIKSTALLGNVLQKRLAVDAGAFETIMLENGALTEGSSTTVHVIADGTIKTPRNGHRILPGTTREVVTELAMRLGIPSAAVDVPEAQLRAADEIWLAFATRGLVAVTTLDGRPVGSGQPGPLFRRMHGAFEAYIAELKDTPPL